MIRGETTMIPNERMCGPFNTADNIYSLTSTDAVAGSDEAPVARTNASAAKRHKFSVAEKQRILRLADGCTNDEELKALLRREGIYRVTLQRFIAERNQGDLGADSSRQTDSCAVAVAAINKRNAALEREISRMKRQLEKAEIVIDFQKKVGQALGLTEGDMAPPENEAS